MFTALKRKLVALLELQDVVRLLHLVPELLPF